MEKIRYYSIFLLMIFIAACGSQEATSLDPQIV